jgi:hypothetical protein
MTMALEPLATEAVLDHIAPDSDIIMPLGNGEPVTVLDAIERNASQFTNVRIHQMHALHDRPYLHDSGGPLHHISYFLSHVTRPCYREGTIDLVPSNFSEMRDILMRSTKDPLVIAAASMPDRHGYFSLGVSADYVASFIGRARFFLEANPNMPRTFGRNQIHFSQVTGWSEADYPLVEVAPAEVNDIDRAIGGLVAERIANGSTIQTGIGGIPNAVMAALSDHRDLGVHTELISDGVVDLVERGVVNGVAKQLNRTKAVGTFALGTRRLYDFLDENAAFELWPVRYVNDPRVIGQEANFVSINATIAVDRRAGGLRPGCDVLLGRARVRGAALDHAPRADVEDRRPARRRRRGDDVEEHRRQSCHGVRRGRVARAIDSPARPLVDRDRPPGSPRSASLRSSPGGLPVGAQAAGAAGSSGGARRGSCVSGAISTPSGLYVCH